MLAGFRLMVLSCGALLAQAAAAAEREPDIRVYTEPGDLPQLKVQQDGKTVDLPLKHTHISGVVTGNIAEVEVTQTYQNPYDHPIEAVYVFPLPENSAVYAMKMVIGERVIEAEIQKRAEARATYEAAKAAGHTAALLEQERPNVFTQSVANIEPGTDIDVIVKYLQDLTYDAGTYEFVFPMVVGPRFMPGEALNRPQSGTGGKADTTQVPDASRISPPVLGHGLRSGHTISLDLTVNAGVPILDYEVPTHKVDASLDKNVLKLSLAKDDVIPNRDFVLHYNVGGKLPEASFMSHKADKGGFFTLLVQPPRLDVEALVGQRELIFVVDVSGSMSGVPLAMCQDAMEAALGMLRPVDTFNVITFSGSTGKVFEKPYPANDANIKTAMEFVRHMVAGGGTYMLDGIAAALSTEIERGRGRYVFFMTDGYVGNEGEILAATAKYVKDLERKQSRARVFGFGVGSSTNRMLLDGLAKAGKGKTVYATTREDPTQAVNSFFRLIDHSIIEDVKLDFGKLGLRDIYPKQIPDLFVSRPLILHGRYDGAGTGTVTLRGRANGKSIELPIQVTLPESRKEDATLEPLWARSAIDEYERDLWGGPAPQAEDAITKLGLEFHLVTAFTSLVAVDRSKKVQGKSETIVQPVEVPEGVDATMAGAAVAGEQRARTKSAAPGRASSYGAADGLAAPSMAPMPATAATPAPMERDKDRRAKSEVSREPAAKPLAGKAGDTGSATSHSGPAIVVSGSLSREEVLATVRQKTRQIRACYDAELQRQPTLQGRFVLRFTIGADGKVTKVEVAETTLQSAAVEGCVSARIKAMRFAAPAGGGTVTVSYPFVFSPTGGGIETGYVPGGFEPGLPCRRRAADCRRRSNA